MKRFFSILILILFEKICIAQFYIISTTELQYSPVSITTNNKNISLNNNSSFEQSIYWQKKYSEFGQNKFMYNLISIYKREDLYGICIYGMDIDMISENFEKIRANKFRYWNKLRFGFKVLVEHETKYKPIALKSIISDLNEEFYISYLHLPQKARGDLMTKYRKHSYMLFIDAIPAEKLISSVSYKALEYVWFKAYYRKEFKISHEGLSVEIEINKHGYDHSLVKYTHDTYKGWSFIIGQEITNSTNSISLYIGAKFNFRNN